MTLPTDMAVTLAHERAERLKQAGDTPRRVPEAVIRQTHRDVSQTFEKALLRGSYDDLELWDTTIEKQPRLVVSAKGKDYKIHDQKLWETFQAKGKK
jgi:hypothetical protein